MFKPAIFIYFDGSFKNNKGAIGYYIETQGNELIHKNNKLYPKLKNNTEAEYKSLEYALIKTKQICGSDNRLFIFGDEKTVLENHTSHNKINEIIQQFESVIITQIPSHENKAHYLANKLL